MLAQQHAQASKKQLLQLKKRQTCFSSLQEMTAQVEANTRKLETLWAQVHAAESAIEQQRSATLKDLQPLQLERENNQTLLAGLDVKAHQLES